MAGAGSKCTSIINRIRIIFFFDDGHLCFAIGDVSDKGVPAPLFVAVTKTFFQSTAGNSGTPGEILARLNPETRHDNDSCMFVTLFYGILNIRTGQVDYSNGGHNLPYHLHHDGVRRLENIGGGSFRQGGRNLLSSKRRAEVLIHGH